MELEGTVREDGLIATECENPLPAGTKVAITSKEQPVKKKPAAGDELPLGQWLLQFSDILEGLPADMSVNHAHYRLGVPKVEDSDERLGEGTGHA